MRPQGQAYTGESLYITDQWGILQLPVSTLYIMDQTTGALGVELATTL